VNNGASIPDFMDYQQNTNVTTKLPNCGLSAGTWFYVFIAESVAVAVTVSAKTVTSQITTLTIGENDLTHVDGDFWVGQYTVSNSQSVVVSTIFDSGMDDLGEVQIAEGFCGSGNTPATAQTTTGAGTVSIRTSAASPTMYFVVDGRGFTSYSLTISVENTVCKNIKSSICHEVNYPTFPNDPSDVSDYDSDLEDFKTTTTENLSKKCAADTLRLQCYLTYPKCDENNFPVYPCFDYCQTLLPVDCADESSGFDGSDIITCYESEFPTTNCFSSGMFLQVPLLVIISFIGMLFLV